MSFNSNAPKVDEIVIVPLVHPGGIYIRLADNRKVPVLAKVRFVYSDTVNVINYFGYTYNVPIDHVEHVKYNIPTKFYTDTIDNASQIMSSLGYEKLDNSEFFKKTIYSSTYSFLPQLPNADNIYTNVPGVRPNGVTFGQPIEIFSPKPIVTHNTSPDTDEYNGTIHVMDINNTAMLHIISRSNKEILFDRQTGQLSIRGYATFIIDATYNYEEADTYTSYVIFKSQKNYIQVKKKHVVYTPIDKYKVKRDGYYKIKTIKPKRDKSSHKEYFTIMSLINKNFRF